MRSRLAKTGLLLLVIVLVAIGLSGCERSAETRGSESADAAATGESSNATPVPGETIVSAVTSSPGSSSGTSGGEAQPQPTVGSAAGGTPVSSAPTATIAAGDSTQPTAQPAATQAPPATEAGVVWHTVQRGETVYSIASRYGTTVDAIAAANNLSNPQTIYVGQKLKIPTSGGSTSSEPPPTEGGATGCRIKHTVKPGEWVWQIARNYGVEPNDILAANNMSIQSARTIHPGMVLCIP
jgi:LysM repeat protein